MKCSQCYRALCSCRCSSINAKIIESVCKYVMSGYAFYHASRYRAETWHGGRGLAHEACGHIFEATPPGVKGHPGSIYLKNALWLNNLVRKTPDQSIVHCWGQRSCRGHLGPTRGQIKYLMATKFGEKNPRPKHNALLGSKVVEGVSWGQDESICLARPYGHQI